MRLNILMSKNMLACLKKHSISTHNDNGKSGRCREDFKDEQRRAGLLIPDLQEERGAFPKLGLPAISNAKRVPKTEFRTELAARKSVEVFVVCHHVSLPPHCQQHLQFAGIIPQLFPQIGDVHVHGACLHFGRVQPPDMQQKFIA